MSRRNLYWLLGIISVAMLGFAVSYSAPTRDREKDYELIRLVVDVLHEVDTKYVVDLDPERKRKLVEDMVNGGLERLDPHSTYINAKDYKHFDKQNRGKFGGIGIQVGYDRQNRGVLTVISPIPGTPAYEARSTNDDRILAGDAIVKIDGKPTEGMRIGDAVDLIQGDPGKAIVLTVQHEGGKEPFDIPIVRAEIKVQSIMGYTRNVNNPEKWDYLVDRKNKIGYVRITGFSEKTSQELIAALKDMTDEAKPDQLKGLILDLRNNPGGLLREAVHISNLFLKPGERIVSTKGRNSRDEIYDAQTEEELLKSIYRDEDNASELRAWARDVTLLTADRPIAVLVNKHSASASEILSAALKDNKRAIVVGERSYGKGSVQNIIMMNKDKEPSALKLTTASYWRPSGKNIHRFPESKETDDWGVKPSEGYQVAMKDDERYEYVQYRSEMDVVRTKPKVRKPTASTSVSAVPPSGISGDLAACPVLLTMPWGTVWSNSMNQKGLENFKDRVLDKALEYFRK